MALNYLAIIDRIESLAYLTKRKEMEILVSLGLPEEDTYALGELFGNEKAKDALRCKAVVYHGPGHQSSIECIVTGEHKTHRAFVYGQEIEWEGDSTFC